MNTLPKLGKLAPKHDPRTLKLVNYLFLPSFPESYQWSLKASSNWGMMKNDRIGCCTCAAAGHMIQDWTANCGNEVTISDNDVIVAYSGNSGYNPKTGENDNGAVEMDVLKYWRKIGIGNHFIEAFVSVNLRNLNHVKAAIYLFGGIYVGIALPITAQNQDIWNVAYGPDANGDDTVPGSWGGHAVTIIDYDKYGLTCITWGAKKRMTWDFFSKYCDEAYAIISPDFFVDGKAPHGFNIDELRKDLAAL